MTLTHVHGLPAVFETDDPVLDALTERERRLLAGALNFHALMAPERTLDVHLYDGGVENTPRTTDDSTFTGESRENRKRLHTFRVRSLAPVENRTAGPAENEAEQLIGRTSRHLHISRDEVLEFDPIRPARTDLVGRIARRVKAKTPLLYDDLRDVVLARHTRRLNRPVERQQYDRQFAAEHVHPAARVELAGPVPEGAPRAVIIGMHWFELGGAERWAFETVRLVKEAGFLPIVLTNRDSQHPWITRSELDGAMLIPFSEPTVLSQSLGVEQLLRALLRTFDVRGVVVHHNQWLYDRLAWIVRSRPGIPVVDSTHIVEYRGGGYPLSGALVTESITKHHVISPSLAKWMTRAQRIPEDKVVMAPLGGLTVKPKDARFRARKDGEPFTVAFVGRMARQKAPEVFVAMARRLRRVDPGIRFILHGDGELASWVDDVIAGMGMTDAIERRTSAVPVSRTLDEAHVLVVSSHNEGLTLTTLEAITHGVPVVSTDVGAQRDIIPDIALVPRFAHRASRGLASVVSRLVNDEAAREQLWRRERKAEKKLLANTTATEWFAEEVRGW
ncbi:glycosyltransferase [Microbacterium neungamense]|uniref:glycosyltransferase n=1 Tax=Microbacterium neungamense TaxID=2810535 RepID=UPI00217EADE6|nr:glycosyltransferase [Microbacterium neungamense]UWF78171.1 glycosyltransferase [Microbacterium neungamense]